MYALFIWNSMLFHRIYIISFHYKEKVPALINILVATLARHSKNYHITYISSSDKFFPKLIHSYQKGRIVLSDLMATFTSRQSQMEWIKRMSH